MEQESPLNYDQLLDEAIQWLGKLNAGILSSDENQDFINWVNTSSNHRKAYEEMSEVWQATEGMQDLPQFKQEADDLIQQSQTPSGKKTSWLVSIAASFVMAVGILYTQYSPKDSSIQPERFASEIGETKNINLTDGSKILLNTNTRIEIAFMNSRRAVTLLQGEALFEVASDNLRPFVVDTGNSQVRAIGTAFNIKKQDAETIVTVTEGIVSIERSDSGKPIQANQRVTASRNDRVVVEQHSAMTLEHANIEQELAWVDSQLIYYDTSIDQVINDLNAYLEKPLVLQDTSLMHLKVNGTLNVKDPEQALFALLTSFNLKTIDKGHSREILSL